MRVERVRGRAGERRGRPTGRELRCCGESRSRHSHRCQTGPYGFNLVRERLRGSGESWRGVTALTVELSIRMKHVVFVPVPILALDWNSDSVSVSVSCHRLCHQLSDGTDVEDLTVLATVVH
ncbi:hypothetical protein Syun_020907 [Stephania yunnanensis]|uniref:Uncharacterized protein n=1 Tax=Stephania yunnanensis TaxID=152371 RepID=A0AAP0IF25_9MAGN